MSIPSRGDYRSIYVVILDSENYAQLTAFEQHILTHLKLLLGYTGIGVLSIARLTEVSGRDANAEEVRLAVDELVRTGWLRKEKNVVWLINGLRYEPTVSAKSKEIRKGVQRRLAGLPRVDLVDEFRRYYAEFFVDDGAPGGEGREGAAGGSAGVPVTAMDMGKSSRSKTELTTRDRAEFSTKPPPREFLEETSPAGRIRLVVE